jgi:hypothetical protein
LAVSPSSNISPKHIDRCGAKTHLYRAQKRHIQTNRTGLHPEHRPRRREVGVAGLRWSDTSVIAEPLVNLPIHSDIASPIQGLQQKGSLVSQPVNLPRSSKIKPAMKDEGYLWQEV